MLHVQCCNVCFSFSLFLFCFFKLIFIGKYAQHKLLLVNGFGIADPLPLDLTVPNYVGADVIQIHGISYNCLM